MLRYMLDTNTCIYVVPARKPPNFAPKAASYRRCQPEIRLHVQVFGPNWPLTTHGRTNFKISSIESLLRETERNNQEEKSGCAS